MMSHSIGKTVTTMCPCVHAYDATTGTCHTPYTLHHDGSGGCLTFHCLPWQAGDAHSAVPMQLGASGWEHGKATVCRMARWATAHATAHASGEAATAHVRLWPARRSINSLASVWVSHACMPSPRIMANMRGRRKIQSNAYCVFQSIFLGKISSRETCKRVYFRATTDEHTLSKQPCIFQDTLGEDGRSYGPRTPAEHVTHGRLDLAVVLSQYRCPLDEQVPA